MQQIAGLTMAKGDCIIYLDDDGQSPIDEMWKLVDKMNEGYDLVFAKFKTKKNSAFQNFGSKLNNIMAKYLIGKPKNLHMGNFWIAQNYIIKEICKCQNPYPYLGGLLLKTTDNIADVETDHHERVVGKSNYTLKKMISLWLNGFTAFSVLPLRVATIMGFSCSSIGFLYTIFVFINKLLHPNIPLGYSSLMAVILILGGLILLTLGIIGEYIGRIYVNINKIPQYCYRTKINC